MTPNNKDFIAEFCAKMEAQLTPFCEVGSDIKQNIRAVAEAMLGKMDVVSRTELDEKTELLAKAVEKMHELEEKIAKLEARGGANPDGAQPPNTDKS